MLLIRSDIYKHSLERAVRFPERLCSQLPPPAFRYDLADRGSSSLVSLDSGFPFLSMQDPVSTVRVGAPRGSAQPSFDVRKVSENPNRSRKKRTEVSTF